MGGVVGLGCGSGNRYWSGYGLGYLWELHVLSGPRRGMCVCVCHSLCCQSEKKHLQRGNLEFSWDYIISVWRAQIQVGTQIVFPVVG